jgi:hypothetical protein
VGGGGVHVPSLECLLVTPSSLPDGRWAALGYASPNHRFRGGGGGLDQRAHALALARRRDEAETFYRRADPYPYP